MAWPILRCGCSPLTSSNTVWTPKGSFRQHFVWMLSVNCREVIGTLMMCTPLCDQWLDAYSSAVCVAGSGVNSLGGHSVIGDKNSWTSAKISAPDYVHGLFSACQPFHCLQQYSGNTQNIVKPPSPWCSSQTVKGWSKSCSCITSLLQIWFSNT